MKKCPFCAEDIQDAAIVCRYCGRDLPTPESKAASHTTPRQIDVVGVSRHQKSIRAVLATSGSRFNAIITPDPGNHYDKNAISVSGPGGDMLGHLGQEMAAELKGQFDQGLTTVPATITGEKKNDLSVVLDWNHRKTDLDRTPPQRVGQTVPAAETRAGSNTALGCLTAVVILFGGCFVWFMVAGPDGGTSSSGSAETTVLCENAMRARLRAPGTADFPAFHVGNVESLGENRYRLRSYVDAENAFGGEVRTNFVCTVERSGRELSNYSVTDFTVLD